MYTILSEPFNISSFFLRRDLLIGQFLKLLYITDRLTKIKRKGSQHTSQILVAKYSPACIKGKSGQFKTIVASLVIRVYVEHLFNGAFFRTLVCVMICCFVVILVTVVGNKLFKLKRMSTWNKAAGLYN